MAKPFESSGIFRHRFIGAERVRATLFNLADEARKEIRRACVALARKVQSATQANARAKLNKYSEGRSAASVKVASVAKGDSIYALCFSKWYIFRFWEEGFGPGPFKVKDHTRRGYRVSGSMRRIYGAPRPMMRPAFDGLRGSIHKELSEALDRATNKAKHGNNERK